MTAKADNARTEKAMRDRAAARKQAEVRRLAEVKLIAEAKERNSEFVMCPECQHSHFLFDEGHLAACETCPCEHRYGEELPS